MKEVLIIGAGASGLLAAVKLRQAGRSDFLLLERSGRVGGTWRDNTYPGVACDVPSHLYSFSFEPNPEWSQVYSPQVEILAYLERVAEKYGLMPHIRFGCLATEARYQEQTCHWEVILQSGETLSARYLFHGGGGLERPYYPDIQGLGDFPGVSFHSARWRGDHDFKGRRVAVIGSAASAVQLLPPVAEQAAQVYLFQRTPNWVVPKHNRFYGPWEKAAFRHFPGLARLYRHLLFLRLEMSFALMQKNSWVARLIERLALRRMRRHIREERLRALLTPTYPMGCKRILLSNDFYPTLARPNVEVIGESIAGAGPAGLTTVDGRSFQVDTIVFATGFRVYDSRIAYYGQSGQTLPREGPEAYKGMTVAGFPNLFLLIGPNSALGHNSVWLMSEAQADCAVRAMAEVERRKKQGLVPRLRAQADYNRDLQERFRDLVWTGGCQSWYQTAAGKNFTIFPGNVREYQGMMAAEEWRDFDFLPAGA